MIHFLWKVGDWFAKWKRGGGGGGALYLCVRSSSFFLIAKLSESSASRIV